MSSSRTSDAGIAKLYQLPPGEFTAARNALAKRLKNEGDRDGAALVAALAKPNLSSWAVNQIYWRARRVFDALLEAGDRFRKAQSAHLAGRRAEDLQETSRGRQEALDAALKAGLEFLRESGSATPAMRDRIARTLEAIGAYGRTSPEEARGRLSADLNPPGFEALAALAGAVQGAPALRLVKPATVRETGEAPRRKETGRAATPSREKPKPKSDRAPTERDRAREARHAAALKDARSRLTREEAALRLRTGEAGSAAKRSDEAARDERDALAALERARREMAEAEREAQKARTARKAAEVHARQSAAALEKAERTAASARAEVEKLEQTE